MPTSAACVVANGVRETLTSLLDAPVAMRLFEPAVPDQDGWRAIAHNAMLYRVPGSVADAAVILRAVDAIALVGAVFGEPPTRPSDDRALSPIECDIIDRTAKVIAGNLCVVCGPREAHPVERVAAIGGFVTFFELMLEKPIEARIGIALSRDPSPEPRGCFELGHLTDVRVTTIASLDLGNVPAAAVAGLVTGAILPMRSSDLRRCSLTASGRRLARGTCGVRNGRYAIAAQALREAM